MNKNTSKLYNIPDEEFKNIVENAISLTDCIKQCGFSIYGRHGREVILKRCEELNLDTTHFQTKEKLRESFSKRIKGKTKEELHIPNEKIFIEHSTYKQVRNRILKDNLIEYKCEICGNPGEYNGEPLVLHLDHKNGVHDDNRLENLRFLCPNCHSQTKTFGAKNMNKNSSVNE